MQLQIVLITFSLYFCKILTKTETNSKSLKDVKKHFDSGDIDDTPSPEWIKYQQERFQNSDTLLSIHQNNKQINSQLKTPPVSKVGMSKVEATSRQKSYLQDQVQQDDSKHPDDTTEEYITPDVEFPSIKGFVQFIKSLKQNWTKHSLFSIDDKIKMLHQLKDSLLKTIEQQFMILWQNAEHDSDHIATMEQHEQNTEMREKKGASHLRSKRGILDESNINFPPDAALISINFLTFAVFLIKLVLQVVNIVKTKHYKLTTFNMNTGATTNG